MVFDGNAVSANFIGGNGRQFIMCTLFVSL